MDREIVFSFKTKGNTTPKDKPRVYFSCHPEDFDRFFERICSDIFKTHDCTVFYTEDMSKEIIHENNLLDLERMNLFVIPVSFHLLSQPNRTIEFDLKFADEKCIPVLPIMMEPNIDGLYQKVFGDKLYLNPFSKDTSEILYEEKLDKYLNSVLINDELTARIHDAFDLYIFLSYRKKDRKYANDLMRLIHNNSKFRNIAIWFDEFLTPGESFKDNIEKMLKKSELFALLVTPNLLETPEGKPNFIMAEEYPKAIESRMSILPAEVKETDRKKLKKFFKSIPEPVDTDDKDAFYSRLSSALSKAALSCNNEDPVHNYLVGLAYLNGIDVEVDIKLGIELISKSGAAELPEAMIKLYEMFENGIKVKIDYQKAKYWAEKILEYCRKEYGENDSNTLMAQNNLACILGNLGENVEALETQKKVFEKSQSVFGNEHHDTLLFLNNLSRAYDGVGDYKQSLVTQKKAYELLCSSLGENNPLTLSSLNNLAYEYGRRGDYCRFLELTKESYEKRKQVLGDENPDTLTSLNNLSGAYVELGEYNKALDIQLETYELRCRVLGDDHPDTLTTLSNLSASLRKVGLIDDALEFGETAYNISCQTQGETHPNTLYITLNLAQSYNCYGEHTKALKLAEKVYEVRLQLFGENHYDTIVTLGVLADTYDKLGQHNKALEQYEQVYKQLCGVLGNKHPRSLAFQNKLIKAYDKNREYEKEMTLLKDKYKIQHELLGEQNEKTLKTNQEILALKAKMLG